VGHAYRTCARPRGALERFDGELGYIEFACCGVELSLYVVEAPQGRKARRGKEQGMAAQSSSKSIDVQKVISGAAELEVKALLAGVEYLQVWISQAGKLAGIAGDTLQAIKNDKGSLSDTARRLTDFGKQNAEVFADLSSKMSKSYYSELDRIVTAVTSKPEKPKSRVRAAARSPAAGKVSRRKPRAKKAGKKA
jgi:hypothetical protein